MALTFRPCKPQIGHVFKRFQHDKFINISLRTSWAGRPTAHALPQAISGLGGVGKTQLVLEYVYRHRRDYQAVLWAQADTREALTSSYLSIATLLDLPEKDASESALVIAAVKQWLQRQTGWLLILDNADELTLVRDFLPPQMGGQVLLTTRAQAMGRFARRVEVEVLPTEVGALFLLRRADLLALEAAFEQAEEAQQERARAICEQLGGLPLALDQAGAYMEETGCSLLEYQRLFERRRADLLARRGGVVEDHPHPVATTWSLSFEKVEQRNPEAADLLRMSAFLAPDAIPEEILTEGASFLGPKLASVGADAYLLNKVIEVLRAYSLLRRDVPNHILSLHRLVQVVLRDALTDEIQQQWAERVVKAVNHTFPEVKLATWPQCQRLLSQAQACSDLMLRWQIALPEGGHLLSRANCYALEQGRFSLAEELLVDCLALYERVEEGGGIETAAVCSRLGVVSNKLGKYAQAETYLQRAMRLYEQLVGPMHPEFATILDNRACLYEAQGNDEQAEALYVQSMKIQEGIWGPEHLKVAIVMSNLAGLYTKRGRYGQAESLYHRVLVIEETHFGSLHPDLAATLNNLAWCYQTQGKYAQALPLYQRAFQIEEQTVGMNHPQVAVLLTNMAHNMEAQGDHVRAEDLYRQALSLAERTVGRDHPITATILHRLAGLMASQGHQEQGEIFYRQALAIRERSLPASHPDMIATLTALAHLYYGCERYAEGDSFQSRVLAIHRERSGTLSWEVASALYTLAVSAQAQKLSSQAEPRYREFLDLVEQLGEQDHADIIMQALKEMVSLSLDLGQYDQATVFQQRLVGLCRECLGEDHSLAINCLLILATLYTRQDQHDQAEPHYQRVLMFQQQTNGAEHSETMQILDLLAKHYLHQQKYSEALSLLQRLLSIHERLLGPVNMIT